jgi:4-amino-4-deoxy-L-arabinose transferase-like glycosyltransferase
MRRGDFLAWAGLSLIFAAKGTESLVLIAGLGAAGVALLAAALARMDK